MLAVQNEADYFVSTYFYSRLTNNLATYQFDNVQKWMKGVDLFEYNKVFIPVHRKGHWLLVVVAPKEQRISLLDSLGGEDPTLLKVRFRSLLHTPIPISPKKNIPILN